MTGTFRVTSISLYCTRISIQSSLKLHHHQSKRLIQTRLTFLQGFILAIPPAVTCSCCWAAKRCPNVIVHSGGALIFKIKSDHIFGRLKKIPAYAALWLDIVEARSLHISLYIFQGNSDSVAKCAISLGVMHLQNCISGEISV